MRSLTCSHIRASAGSTFLRRPGWRDSSTPTISMPSFVRTLDQHRTTTNRTPARKSFTQPDPRSSSGYRKTPRFPVDNERYQPTIYTEFSWSCAITSKQGKPWNMHSRLAATSSEGIDDHRCITVNEVYVYMYIFLPSHKSHSPTRGVLYVDSVKRVSGDCE